MNVRGVGLSAAPIIAVVPSIIPEVSFLHLTRLEEQLHIAIANGVLTPTGTATATVTSSSNIASMVVAGTAPGDGTVEIFSDPGSQGALFLGRSTVVNGSWTLTVQADVSKNITATYTDTIGDTSAFSVLSTQMTQTVAFPVIGNLVFDSAPIPLSATASSGLVVTFSVVGGPATVSGTTLTVTGTGTVVVAADQAGNATYAAAPEVSQSILITAASTSSSNRCGSGSANALILLTFAMIGFRRRLG